MAFTYNEQIQIDRIEKKLDKILEVTRPDLFMTKEDLEKLRKQPTEEENKIKKLKRKRKLTPEEKNELEIITTKTFKKRKGNIENIETQELIEED